jgi:hypothetical protein
MMVGETVKDIDISMPKDAYDTGKYTPTFSAYLTIVVRDSKGRIINIHRQRSHSPTANFIALLLPYNYYSQINGSLTITNIGGGTCSYQPQPNVNTYNIIYPNANVKYTPPGYLVMIQVGSGQQSNPFSATKLAAPIANGSGTGQLLYGSVSIANGIVTSGSSAYFQISQAYTNATSGTVTITEVGIVVQIYTCSAAQSSPTNCGQVLVWYDVLSSAINVPANGTLVIYYTFTVNP